MICYREPRVVFLARHYLNRLVPRLKRRDLVPEWPRLCAFPNDLIGRETAVAGLYEMAGIKAIQLTLRANAVNGKASMFLDIGANIGTYAVSLASEFTSVQAFEPHPITRRLLEINFEANGIANGIVHPEALSDHDGAAYLFDCPDNVGASTLEGQRQGSGSHSYKVKVQRGDGLWERGLSGKVGLIKIDVEGHELKVINGLAATIKRDMPVIAFEANTGSAAEAVERRLRELGYTTFWGLDYYPRPRLMVLRVLILLILGVRYSLAPVRPLLANKYSLVFAFTDDQAVRMRRLS